MKYVSPKQDSYFTCLLAVKIHSPAFSSLSSSFLSFSFLLFSLSLYIYMCVCEDNSFLGIPNKHQLDKRANIWCRDRSSSSYTIEEEPSPKLLSSPSSERVNIQANPSRENSDTNWKLLEIKHYKEKVTTFSIQSRIILVERYIKQTRRPALDTPSR